MMMVFVGILAWLLSITRIGSYANEISTVVNNDSPGSSTQYKHAVKAFHYILYHWGASRTGQVPCGDIYCEWVASDHVVHLRNNYLYTTDHRVHNLDLLTVSVYNIHTLWEKYRDSHPLTCELATNLTFAESEECFVRYGPLLESGMKNFDGLSTTHPKTAVPRIYVEALINNTDLMPTLNFSSLVKGGSYIASDCHRRDSANANRDGVVQQIRDAGFRVDGLGRCMNSGPNAEGISLPRTRDTRYNLYIKRQALNRYMFNMAFENSIEPGYVTEKPFDALLAGSVPVYLGDADQLKYLLPHPKAAIFVADFPNVTALVQYLHYLTKNETAYEEHRAWRANFTYEKNVAGKPLMENSLYCRICEWAVKTAYDPTSHRAPRKICLPPKEVVESTVVKQKLPPEFENLAIRPKNSKQVYVVHNGILHSIPDLPTFLALNMSLESIHVIEPDEMKHMIVGESLQSKVPQ